MNHSNPNQPPASLDELFGALAHTHALLQQQAARSVDIALVARNWLFGRHIVEFEDGASSRANLYGKRLLDNLAQRLTDRLGAGFSKRNLEQCRRFYLCYSGISAWGGRTM